MNTYISTKSGNILHRSKYKFYWRGKWFSGLVDIKENALYDNPDDSFFEHLGYGKIDLERGNIKLKDSQ